MDIFVYGFCGDEIRLKGVTDTVAEMNWRKHFYSCDEFDIILPLTDRNAGIFTQNSIVEIPGRYSGMITEIRIDQAGRDYYIKASGCSFDGMFGRRILTDYEDGDSMLEVIYRNCGSAAGETRRFPVTEFDFSLDCDTTLAEAYRFRSLAAFVKASGQLGGVDVHGELAHSGIRHYIRFYGRKPADRSVLQNVNRRIVFSDRFDSFSRADYAYSEKGAMTGAVVYSDSKYLYNSYIPQWHTFYGDESKGFERCEKAFKIQPKIEYVQKTLAGTTVYVPDLDEEATENYGRYVHLSNYRDFDERLCISIPVKEGYSTDFDVGDRVTVECSRFGKLLEKNICEIHERFADGGFTAEAIIGDF